MKYKTVHDLVSTGIKNRRILLRLDLNVPIKDGKVVDDYRIRKSYPTIQLLKDAGAKIIIIAHIEGGSDTLRPVYEYIQKDFPITFCEDCIEDSEKYISNLKAGEILLCENLRLYGGEKKNDPEFAQKLAAMGDSYVNDGFSVSHRKHASIVGVPKFLPGYLGLQFEQEITNLSKVFNPPRPFLFILGGAKFETKLPLVTKFLPIADTIFIGGALANDFYKAKGLEVGKSLLSDSVLDLSELVTNKKIVLPVDVIVDTPTGQETKKAVNIGKKDIVRDDGRQSLDELRQLISEAQAVLWNGTLGNYELGFQEQTLNLAKIISECNALSIVGGGDTLAAIAKLQVETKFSFVSTGGGAMLDFLANETLPGLEALKK